MPFGYGASKNYSSSSNTRESYRTSNAYNSKSYNAGITKSTKTNTVKNNNNNNNKETYKTTTYTTTKVSEATKRRNQLALDLQKQKQDAEARSVLVEKCMILAHGSEKRNKLKDASRYRKLAQTYDSVVIQHNQSRILTK